MLATTLTPDAVHMPTLHFTISTPRNRLRADPHQSTLIIVVRLTHRGEVYLLVHDEGYAVADWQDADLDALVLTDDLVEVLQCSPIVDPLGS